MLPLKLYKLIILQQCAMGIPMLIALVQYFMDKMLKDKSDVHPQSG